MFLKIKDLKKGFGSGDSRTEVLRGIDFSVEKGEFCVLLGPSGSGKSTLLNIIGGIDEPDEGYISIDGEKTGDMKEKALTLYRRKHLGYVFQIRIKDVGDFIQIEIEDNGKGIGPKDLPYIFDRFYRTDVSRNSSKGGSGIGLSIVKKILEDHGGKVWATSRLGIGTIMYFVLRKYQEVPMK